MTSNLLLVSDERTSRWAGDGFPAQPLRSLDDVFGAWDRVAGARRPVIWIAHNATQVCPLVQHSQRTSANHRLFLLNRTNRLEREVLSLVFRFIVSPGDGVRLLPMDELKDVLAAPERGDLFIGGFTSPCDELVVLYRGTLEPLAVPFSWFTRRQGASPHFEDLSITDFGQTVAFGDYEVAADMILYAHDAEYRKRAKQRELAHDDSFGASVRRLRLAHGLRRGDFPGISDKEVARIERGEIARPHGRTLETIAARLGVAVEELGTF